MVHRHAVHAGRSGVLIAAMILLTLVRPLPAVAGEAQAAQSSTADPMQRTVTLTAQNQSISVLLGQMFSQAAPLTYEVDAAADFGNQLGNPVSVSIQDMPIGKALDLVLKANGSGLGWRYDGSRVIIFRPSQVGTVQGTGQTIKVTMPRDDSRKVTFASSGVSLEATLRQFIATIPGLSLDIGDTGSQLETKVSVDLKDMLFRDAMDTILRGQDIGWRMEGETVVLYKIDRSGIVIHVTPVAADEGIPSTPVTLSLPRMSAEAAVAQIDPGWSFQGGLGAAVMPGAKFVNFPRDLAVGVVLAASGLTPPSHGSKVVTAQGKTTLAQICQWRPVDSGTVAVAGCRLGSNWLFALMSGQTIDTDVVASLMAASDVRYLTCDISERMTSRTQTSPATDGDVESTFEIPAQPSTISVRLFDATLDEALKSLLPTIGLTLKKSGPPQNPIYVIQGARTLHGYIGQSLGSMMR